MSRHERTRNAMERNEARAAKGGPEYRQHGAGKGDVDRARNKTKFDLGMDLISVAEEFGKDSKEYKKVLKAWRNA